VLQAQVTGPLAKEGPRMIEVVSAMIAKSFFSAFEARLLQASADMGPDRSAAQGKTGSPAKRWLWIRSSVQEWRCSTSSARDRPEMGD